MVHIVHNCGDDELADADFGGDGDDDNNCGPSAVW